MKLDENWDQIRDVVSRGKRSTGHFAIASVDSRGRPHVTPVGTFFLRDDLTGFYFEQYTSTLAQHLNANPQVCVMAVDRSSWFWLRSLLEGRFSAPPGVRLYGTAGARRLATAAELELVAKTVKPARWLKGGRLLWSDFSHVRDISFTEFRPVRYPVMMSHLWQPTPE
ncbi:pyridoxamine 5'-phosphate oxidase family protein [Nocardia yamanashiensis]|uniref:pyridoxamine 5'-phosphate oxidase family protein n=1 Tax=Nocardia yamanashiensis TaxID=209247 RepID=UPI001E33BA22|nr:pyridoxamine 5'-phosphate oxidase family protein [Nocardia yamanashiensis]UGT42576.1 pyridoxamine 5'-phosphate oxidase family protein [Nocardia yamanashiensis]